MGEQPPHPASDEASHPDRLPRITPREQEILGLIAEGLTDQEIANRLCISIHTVHTHVAHLREKFQVPNRVVLMREAQRSGHIASIPEKSPFLAIGERPHLGYTPDQELAPQPSPDQPGGEPSADAEGETEMLNPRLRFWYLAALLAVGGQNNPAAAQAGPCSRTRRGMESAASVDTKDKAASMVARRIWSGPEVDLYVCPSPDGRYLSFVDWDTGDLALRDLATGKSRRLTNKGSWHDSSAWAEHSAISLDGKQVAYTWMNQEGWRYELRLIGRDGSGLRVLHRTNEAGASICPHDWSPDGRQILALLSPKDKAHQIVWISVADGSLQVLKTFDWGGPSRMRLSPDGRTLAYDAPTQAGAPERDLFLLATDGSREVPLVQHPADDVLIGWAPDGRHLLYASDRMGSLGLWRVRIDARQPHGAPELVKREMGTWSPLGLTRDSSLYYGVQAGNTDVYIAGIDPATGKLLAPPQPVNPRLLGSNSSPAWSSDGRHLAYLSTERNSLRVLTNQDYAGVVSIRCVASGETRELSLKRAIYQPSWSPDGGSLLAVGGGAGGETFRIDTQTGVLTAIPMTAGYPWIALSSPNGKDCFYVADDETRNGHVIRVRDLNTGREKELYRTPVIRTLAVSHDGRQLAFTEEDAGFRTMALRVVPAAGGEPRELLRAQDGEPRIQAIAWMPDGRHLLFGRGHWGKTTEILRIPVAGGEPQRVGLAMPALRGLCMHPDGRRLAFTAGSPEIEIWVMENGLPTAQTARASAPRQ